MTALQVGWNTSWVGMDWDGSDTGWWELGMGTKSAFRCRAGL